MQQLTIWQSCQIVVNGIVQQSFARYSLIGHIGNRANTTNDFAVIADNWPRLDVHPMELAAMRSQSEVLMNAPPTVIEHNVQC